MTSIPVGRRGDVVLPLSALCVGVALWWLLTAALSVPSYLLPSPAAVATQLVENPALYLRSAAATIRTVAYGGSAGIASGFALGVLVGSSATLRTALYPYLVAVRVLPKIAVAPILLIYLGTGTATTVVFVALIAFFPLVLNTAAGLARTPDRHAELLRSVDADPLETLLRVRLPYAVPDFFAGLKQSVTLSVVGAVVAEWVVASGGLGYLVLIGSENIRTDIVVAALLALVAVGLALYGLTVGAQRLVRRRLPTR